MVFVRSWSEGVVISIIVATLIEMIIPNNTSKKYIKIVIGIFIVYNVICPILNKFNKSSIEHSFENFEDTVQVTNSEVYSYSQASVDESIKKIYEQNLENNLKQNLKGMGYDTGKVSFKISNDGRYSIEELGIEIKNKEHKEDEKQVGSIVDTIKYVQVNVSSESTKDSTIIDEKDKELITKSISDLYGISWEKIKVYSS